jgi:hypothetical protein
LSERKPQLHALVQQADAAGYELIAGAGGRLLGLMGDRNRSAMPPRSGRSMA